MTELAISHVPTRLWIVVSGGSSAAGGNMPGDAVSAPCSWGVLRPPSSSDASDAWAARAAVVGAGPASVADVPSAVAGDSGPCALSLYTCPLSRS